MRRHDCPWLWLDEPTSALDDTQVVALVALLQSEVRGGRSVAVITHDQRVIAVADKVIEVAHG
jgi:ABC-type transport system involved in cytochrome bd biosynthesis fused ATPase/permease subunit